MVAIKDFGLPSCCGNCDICLPCALDEGICYITQKTLSDIYNKKNSDCPLIEIEQSEDCVSREQARFALTGENLSDMTAIELIALFDRRIKALSPVTPTQLIANIKIDKDELREICKERIEIECQHGTCKDCERSHEMSDSSILCDKLSCIGVDKDFYCKDFEKRGN